MLENLASMKKNGEIKSIIVLINSANALQVDFLKNNDYDVDAALWIGDVGISGINAVAQILVGDVNPPAVWSIPTAMTITAPPCGTSPPASTTAMSRAAMPAKGSTYMIYQEASM